jgi:hypothetical protein
LVARDSDALVVWSVEVKSDSLVDDEEDSLGRVNLGMYKRIGVDGLLDIAISG